ncbi:MAG: PHP domain-containing protein [Proteobacteria bacterium]|nr:PHP domain-containing protein [Pseudomonadota bacterium]
MIKLMSENNGIFSQFCNLTPDLLDCDLHIHTVATDGKASVKEVIVHAEKIGLRRIAFTEHVRADSEWFFKFADDVRELGRQTKVTVLVGCEARILDNKGTLDITDTIRRECDVVLGSVHRFPDSTGGYLAFSEVPAQEFAQIEFELALGFLRHGHGDVLAHPGGMSIKFGYGFPNGLLRQLMRKACERGIAIELNSSYISNMYDFCSLAREENPLISIGSDVHKIDELGQCRNILKEIL